MLCLTLLRLTFFTSRLNNQVPKYISWKCGPDGWAVDAMLADWTSLDRMYAFPPFSLLPAVFQKMDREKVDILVVLPLWRTQSWWPHMLLDLVDTPVVLDHHKQILRHPQYPDVQHPLFPKTKLLACLLSGNASKSKAFRASLPLSSSLPGDQRQGSRMKLFSENGYNFVIENKSIACVPLSQRF
ncbi:reverse transcriptase/ribonuclease h/methyltransferase [Elysia marginata]|uniref:Reverse transcriptase/ribonuclease h/methyltransferase n=1 Tax=Elysia marginata TaxID=1093978 RepID=A0AAV4F6U8_9GAST|nr:reverse transcriptase/ribonuclease h/methyltransferase [Elysia marginata]